MICMKKVLLLLFPLLFCGCNVCVIPCHEYDELESHAFELENEVEELKSCVEKLESEKEELEEENNRLAEIIENATWEFERGNYREGMWHLEEL